MALLAVLLATGSVSVPSDAVLLSLIAVYGVRALAAPPPASPAPPLVRLVSTWDRRRTLTRRGRATLTTCVVATAGAFLFAPAVASMAWPGKVVFPNQPLRDYRALAAVWTFRAALGQRQLAEVCDKLADLPASDRAPCQDVALIAANVQDSDPLVRSGGPVFGAGNFDSFYVKEMPATQGMRLWDVYGPDDKQAGVMYTNSGRLDSMTVMISRRPVGGGEANLHSTWLYEVAVRDGFWKITGYRACEVPPAGSGFRPADCVISDAADRQSVEKLIAAARRKAGG